MVTRNDIENFANLHVSFYNNDLNMSLSGEACYLFESGFSFKMSDETRIWIQTYLPADGVERMRLLEVRNNAFLNTDSRQSVQWKRQFVVLLLF